MKAYLVNVFLLFIILISDSCSKNNSPAPLPVSGPTAESWLTDGPWIYTGTTISGYPTNLYDSLFFTLNQPFNPNQYEDSIAGYYTGTRIIIWAFGKFSVSQSPAVPDTLVTLFNPYTAGPSNLDTFLIKTLNDSLMVWGWYNARPPGYEIKYDSLRKKRKF